MSKIDFVVTWVNGADKNWLAKKSKYDGKEIKGMSAERAFREWGVFKYWFRGVEKYAPWVNKIFIVTDNQVPEWLNTDDPMIEIVDHKDYIPHDALPVFSTNAITVNMHRIKGLGEKFVYFNDDQYIINPTKPQDFFYNNLPVDMAVFQPIEPAFYGTAHFQINNMAIINKYFSKKGVMKRSKVYSAKYGLKNNIRTFLFSKNNFIVGFYETHLPEAFFKSTFEQIWKREPIILNKTLHSRFRSDTDVSEWLFRDWQLASGKFYPRNNSKFGKLVGLSNDNREIFNLLHNSNLKILCINDNFGLDNKEKISKDLIRNFDKKFPNKSRFEL